MAGKILLLAQFYRVNPDDLENNPDLLEKMWDYMVSYGR